MMERKGGCCLAPRYGAAAGAGGQASMAWQMGRIMLKFRPIAPKPAAMAPAPTPAPATAVGAGRGKRKAVGGCGGRRGRKPKKAAAVAVTPIMATATATATATSAVPKARDDKDSEKEKSLSTPSSSSSEMTSVDSWPPPPLRLITVSPVENDMEKVAAEVEEPPVAPPHAAGQVVVAPLALRQAASWVTVEDVSGTWGDGEAPSAANCGIGDEAPAFVSDQWGRISWTNAAFNWAVSGGGDDDAAAPEARVGLAAKGSAATVPAWGTCAGFTCRVRVRYACPHRGSVVAPCDVWRLDAGGYLWRLDLQAALSLGALP